MKSIASKIIFHILVLSSFYLGAIPQDIMIAEDTFREAYHQFKQRMEEDFEFQCVFQDIRMFFEFVDMAFSINCAHPRMIHSLMWKHPESSCCPICSEDSRETDEICLILKDSQQRLLNYFSYMDEKFREDAEDALYFEYSGTSTTLLRDRLKMLNRKISDDLESAYHFICEEKIFSYYDLMTFEIVTTEAIDRKMFCKEFFSTLSYMIGKRSMHSCTNHSIVEVKRMMKDLYQQANKAYVLEQAIKLRNS